MAGVLSGVYKITLRRPDTGKVDRVYIGQSTNLRERHLQHIRALRAGRHDNTAMLRAFNKYGEKAFSFENVLFCDHDALTESEQRVLDEQIRTGGRASVMNVMQECIESHKGVKRRPETLARMSASQKGKKKSPHAVVAIKAAAATRRGVPLSDERKARISASHLIILHHPNSLAALSDARNSPRRLEKLRLAIGGKPKVHSAETKAKIAASLTGRTQSAESNAKRSASLMGIKRPPRGEGIPCQIP